MTDLLPYSSQLIVSGSEAVAFLDRTVTCEITNLAGDAPRPGALLTPQGKVIADFLLSRKGEETVRLAVHAEAVDALQKRLTLMRLRANASIERADDRTIAPDDTARIAAGRPAFGTDFGETEVFPTDINLDLLGGIAYRKGCFVGQEVVSRMKRRGTIRRRTVVVEGPALAAGQTVRAGDTRLGDVTSAADGLGLARIRIDHLAKALAAEARMQTDAGPLTIRDAGWLQTELEAAGDVPA